MADQNDYQLGDTDNNIFKKMLNRLAQLVMGGPSSTVTLTASDLEIGAVEIKNATDDTRAIVATAAPGVGDPGLVVRIAGGGSGDGAIVDGANAAIKATVLDLTNSNPVATQLVDANGDPVTTVPISAASLPLPTGAATQATLATRASEATLASIDGKVVAVDTDNVTVVGTVAVSAAALPLPAGAATEATLSALNAKVTAVNTGAVTISAALPAGNNNIGDVDVATLPAIPAGNNNIGDVDVASVPAPLNVVGGGTEAAALRVTLASDSTGLVSVDDNGSSLTVDTTQLPAALVGGRLDVVVGAAIPAGTNNIGDVDVLTLPALPAGNNNIGDVDVASLPALAAGNNNIGDVDLADTIADNNPFTDGTSRVLLSGHIFDEVAGTALTENDAAASRIDSKRAQVLVIEDETTRGRRTTVTAANALKVDGSAVTQPVSVAATLNVNVKPATTGGFTTFHLVSAATTNATNIKSSAGQVFGWYIYNSNAAARKVVFHNTSGTPTAGASVFFSLVIPPSSGANVFTETGIAFSSGIAITTVTGLADNDSAAVALNDLVMNIFYA